jgi:predicted RNA-binding protein YlxR (DUF448 family)
MTKQARSNRRRRVPVRTCVICREAKPKRELTRLVRVDGEGIYVDPSGKRAGRGAYLCSAAACWEKAIQTTALDRALKMTLTEADRDRLRQAAAEVTGD